MPRIVRRCDGKIGIRYDQPGDKVNERNVYIPSLRKHGELDPPIDKPPRPCSRCKNEFQPTVRRRMSCEWCFENHDTGLDG